MTRDVISEPNFISFLWSSRPRHLMPAELRILLSVHLAPMDPEKPYSPLRSDAPRFSDLFLSSEARELIWPYKANLNFNTHLAGSRQQIREGFVFDAADPPNKFRARSWMRQEFEEFKIKFKQTVERGWNDQIILLPPEDPKDGLNDDEYLEMVNNPNMPAHVVCSLEIRFTEHAGNANASMQVVRLCRDENSRAARNRVMPLPGEGPFQSWAWTITNEDLYPQTNTSVRWPNIRITQIGAVHEIGHWLGRPSALGDTDRFFEHIDKKNYPETHPDYHELLYGGTAGRRMALMGAGSLATEYDAAPWLNRVRRHTKALFGWRFVHRSRFVGLVPVSARQKRLLAQTAAPRPTSVSPTSPTSPHP